MNNVQTYITKGTSFTLNTSDFAASSGLYYLNFCSYNTSYSSSSKIYNVNFRIDDGYPTRNGFKVYKVMVSNIKYTFSDGTTVFTNTWNSVGERLDNISLITSDYFCSSIYNTHQTYDGLNYNSAYRVGLSAEITRGSSESSTLSIRFSTAGSAAIIIDTLSQISFSISYVYKLTDVSYHN